MSTVTTIGVADPRPFPDVILRSQFFEMVGTRSLSSEQRLMLAVLADAINVVQEFGGSTSRANATRLTRRGTGSSPRASHVRCRTAAYATRSASTPRACDGVCRSWSPAAAALRFACG